MSGDGDFWRQYTPGGTAGPAGAVAPAVLAQALGSSLAPDEEVICARFVDLTGGPLLGESGRGPHVLIVTDRRVLRVTPRDRRRLLDGVSVAPEPHEWRLGEPVPRGTLHRRSLWLGQIRTVERRGFGRTGRWLTLVAPDGREEGVAGRAEAIGALEAAILAAFDGPGRGTVPPPPPPSPVGGWMERLASILRPDRRTSD